jgi:hypothetical protein
MAKLGTESPFSAICYNGGFCWKRPVPPKSIAGAERATVMACCLAAFRRCSEEADTTREHGGGDVASRKRTTRAFLWFAVLVEGPLLGAKAVGSSGSC